MRKRPFLWIGLTSFLSVLVCSLTSFFIGVVAVLVTTLCLFGVSLVYRRQLSPEITAIVCLWAIVVAIAFSLRMTCVVEPQLALDGTTAQVTMRVEEKVATTDAYIVRVESGTIEAGIRLCFWPGYRRIAPENGDLLTAEIDLVAAYDNEIESGSNAKANGVYLYAWPSGDSGLVWEDGQATLSPLLKALYALRKTIHDTLYRRMSYDGAAFSEGMMLGNCGNISMKIGNAFRTGGVYHLLAVSGSHLVFITGAVFWVLRLFHCSQRLRVVLTMMAIVLFMALCGFTASVNRAGVTTLLMLSGMLFRRRTDGLNSLGFAAGVMLLVDPFCFFDIGWQLSFAATLGLLVFLPVWEQEITARAVQSMPHIASVVGSAGTAAGVTLCASLATIPLSALYFGGISSIFLLGNLVCVPLSSLLLLLNFLSVLTAWLPPFSDVLFVAGEWISQLMTLFTVRLAALPLASVSVDHPLVILWMFALLAGMVWGYRVWRMRGVFRVVAAMLAVLAVGCGLYSLANHNVSRVAVAASDQTVVTVRSDGTCGLIVSADGDALKDAAMLLYDEGITSLDWVLWLGEPSNRATDLSSLFVPIERLLITAPKSGFATLPNAREVTVMEDGGVLTFGDNGALTRCGNFWRLSIGETAYLLAADDSADAAMLPSEWCNAELLLVQAIPDHFERIIADNILAFCAYSDQDAFCEALPDAMIAIKGDTQIVLTRGDGNITLRR